MPKKTAEDLGQGADSGWAASPLERRQQLAPMPPDEAEAFEWVLGKLAELDPDGDVRDLVEDGIDEAWFLVDDDGMLHVNPDAPGAAEHESADEKEPEPWQNPDPA